MQEVSIYNERQISPAIGGGFPVPLLSGGLQGETDAELASRLVIFHTALAAILTLHPNQGRIGEDTNEGEALWNCLHLY